MNLTIIDLIDMGFDLKQPTIEIQKEYYYRNGLAITYINNAWEDTYRGIRIDSIEELKMLFFLINKYELNHEGVNEY